MIMHDLRRIFIAGVISLSALVPKISDAQSVMQSSNAVSTANDSIPIEWDYSDLDSLEMAKIKSRNYPIKYSRPTTTGIESYVNDQYLSVIYDFQKHFNARIYHIGFECDDLSYYPDDSDSIVIVTNLPTDCIVDRLGIYSVKQEYATISSEEKYLGYSLGTTKKSLLFGISSSNSFVRAVMLHELGHDYISQTIAELKYYGYAVDPAFLMKSKSTSYSTFIEEGIAEYCPADMGEILLQKRLDDVVEKFDITNRDMYYSIYSVAFVRDFLDKYGLDGIRLMVSNPPPNAYEIMNPESYFSRLTSPQRMKGYIPYAD